MTKNQTPQSSEGIYVASRASVPSRPAMWRELRAAGWPIVSTWIDEAGPGETADLGELWQRIEAEVRSARGLVLHVEPDDFPLKGALIEVGMALAMGKRVGVYAPGVELEPCSMRPLGSWAKHPQVCICTTLEAARKWAERAPAPQAVPAGAATLVDLQSVELTRDVHGMCVVKINGREAIRDNGDVISHYATLDWFAASTAPQAGEPVGYRAIWRSVRNPKFVMLSSRIVRTPRDAQLILDQWEDARTPDISTAEVEALYASPPLVAQAQPAQPEAPTGYVVVPMGESTPRPDYDECARQATVATGMPSLRGNPWLNIFIREINRWCEHRAAAPLAQPAQEAEAIAREGGEQDLKAAGQLIQAIRQAESNGDALGAVMLYRYDQRLAAARAAQAQTKGD